MEENQVLDQSKSPIELPVTSSVSNSMKLVKLMPEYFAGITPDLDLVIDMSGRLPVVGFTGDNGVCKTSMLEFLQFILGGDEVRNSVNSQFNEKKGEVVFDDPESNVSYVARCTKTGFNLTEITKNEAGEPVATKKLTSPKETLKKLIGPVGVSPMFLKDQKPAEQIKWVRSLFTLTEAQVKDEEKIKNGLKEAKRDRAAVNKEIAQLTNYLTSTPYFRFDPLEKHVVTTPVFGQEKIAHEQDNAEVEEKAKEKFSIATQRRNEHATGVERLKTLNESLEKNKIQIQGIEEQIKLLTEQLQGLNETNKSLEESIEIGNKFVEERANSNAEYDAAYQELMGFNQYRQQKEFLETIEKQYVILGQKEDYKIQVEARIDEYKKAANLFVKAYTPDIEGIEICVPTVVDLKEELKDYKEANPHATAEQIEKFIMDLEDETREGIYYNKKPLLELNESALWDVCMQLWKVQGVSIILVENITSLGSNAIDRLNWFVEKGGTIFYSKMVLGRKQMKVSFSEKLKLKKKSEDSDEMELED